MKQHMKQYHRKRAYKKKLFKIGPWVIPQIQEKCQKSLSNSFFMVELQQNKSWVGQLQILHLVFWIIILPGKVKL